MRLHLSKIPMVYHDLSFKLFSKASKAFLLASNAVCCASSRSSTSGTASLAAPPTMEDIFVRPLDLSRRSRSSPSSGGHSSSDHVRDAGRDSSLARAEERMER